MNYPFPELSSEYFEVFILFQVELKVRLYAEYVNCYSKFQP